MKKYETNEIMIIFSIFEKQIFAEELEIYVKNGYTLIGKYITNKANENCFYILKKQQYL